MTKVILIAVLCGLLWTRADAQGIRAVKISSLDSIIKQSSRPLIVNFWATWCIPCIEELPYFRRVAADFASDSVELILVSLDMKDDYPSRVEGFLKKNGISNRVFWLDEHDADYFCPVISESWSGSIPATLFVNPRTDHRRFFEKQLKEAELSAEIRAMLGAEGAGN